MRARTREGGREGRMFALAFGVGVFVCHVSE